MWRLKIAEGGGDPWLRTKNAHVGRQVWEFDAAATHPDQLAAVEAARRNFTARRHHLKHSADLLMRIQKEEGREVLLKGARAIGKVVAEVFGARSSWTPWISIIAPDSG